jgi:hypothetical protein
MVAERLVTASYVGYVLGLSTDTVRKKARRGEFAEAGVVFISAHGIMFDPVKFEAWRNRGGDGPADEANGQRFAVRHHGGRSHAGVAAQRAGGMRQVTVDAEYTVKHESAEGARKPGQGPTGYEPRWLGGGRNVTEDYPAAPPNRAYPRPCNA